MNQSRLWTVGAVLLIFGLLAGTWFLGVAPRLSEAGEADTARQQAESLNTLHRQTLAALQADFERLEEILDELAEAQTLVPEGQELSAFITEVGELAGRNGVQVTDISFESAAAYEVPDEAEGDYLATATRLAQGGYYVTPVRIDIAVSQRVSVVNFIHSLQTGERLILIHEAEFLSDGIGLGGTVSIKGQLFGLAPDIVPAPEPPPPATGDAAE